MMKIILGRLLAGMSAAALCVHVRTAAGVIAAIRATMNEKETDTRETSGLYTVLFILCFLALSLGIHPNREATPIGYSVLWHGSTE
jgi:hypothetical protein